LKVKKTIRIDKELYNTLKKEFTKKNNRGISEGINLILNKIKESDIEAKEEIRKNIYFKEENYNKLIKLSKNKHLPISEIIKQAYLKYKEEKKN